MADSFITQAAKKPLQTSNVLDDLPSLSVISEGIPDDEEGASMIQAGFGDDAPISEVSPAENSVQRAKRISNTMQGQNENYLDPNAPRKKGFFHLYDSIFNNSYLSRQRINNDLGMTGNDYLHAFGRIDASAKPASSSGLQTGRVNTGGLNGGAINAKAGATTFHETNNDQGQFGYAI